MTLFDKIRKLQKETVALTLKGSSTSGNWGHGGRPGQVGGSTGGGLSGALSDVKDYGRKTGNEKIIVITRDGEKLESTGSSHGAKLPDFGDKEVEVMIHNHPSNDSFTGRDFYVLTENNIQSSVVVGKNGTTYRLDKGPNYKYRADSDEVWSDKFANYMGRGLSNEEHTDRATSDAAKELGLIYSKGKM